MPNGLQTLVSVSLVALLCQPLRADATTDAAAPAWPEKVVALEQLEPLTRFQLRNRYLVTKGKVTGPSVIRSHVDPTGTVTRAVLLTSCGNTDLDEAALHGLREMRFKPFLDRGEAVAVTLVVPIHVPARLGKSHQW